MLYSQQAIDFNVTTNIIDGLISFDNYGKPVPALAKSWEHNEDSTVWTFHLRDDVDWVDMNGEVQDHLTSKDFLVGFEWVLNAKKNQPPTPPCPPPPSWAQPTTTTRLTEWMTPQAKPLLTKTCWPQASASTHRMITPSSTPV